MDPDQSATGGRPCRERAHSQLRRACRYVTIEFAGGVRFHLRAITAPTTKPSVTRDVVTARDCGSATRQLSWPAWRL